MRIFSFCNVKSGVGKTSLVANLGALLAQRGMRVLLVDADAQATLSWHLLGLQCKDRDDEGRTLAGALSRTWQGQNLAGSEAMSFVDTLAPVRSYLPASGALHLLPGSLSLSELDVQLALSLGGTSFARVRSAYMAAHTALARVLLRLSRMYDAVLIDGPANSHMLHRNVLFASDAIVVPARPSQAALRGAHHVQRLHQTLQRDIAAFLDDPAASFVEPSGTEQIWLRPMRSALVGVVLTYMPDQHIEQYVEQARALSPLPLLSSIWRGNSAALVSRGGVPWALLEPTSDAHRVLIDDCASLAADLSWGNG